MSIKPKNIKDKEKILKVAREKRQIIYKGGQVDSTSQQQQWKTEHSGIVSSEL